MSAIESVSGQFPVNHRFDSTPAKPCTWPDQKLSPSHPHTHIHTHTHKLLPFLDSLCITLLDHLVPTPALYNRREREREKKKAVSDTEGIECCCSIPNYTGGSDDTSQLAKPST